MCKPGGPFNDCPGRVISAAGQHLPRGQRELARGLGRVLGQETAALE